MEINIVIMNKLLFCFIVIFSVIGIIVCFQACHFFLKASELELDSSVKQKPYTVELDSLPPPVRDTIELREYLPR